MKYDPNKMTPYQLKQWEEAIEEKMYPEANKKSAELIMDKLFETFEKGGNWIKHCQENGKKTCEVRSPLGRIRHLWLELVLEKGY